MKDNYPKCEARILVYEGGYSNNPKDPGGATMKGITQGTYNSWRSRQHLVARPVKEITDDEVAAIYKHDYWDRTDCDDWAAGVDLCMFDAAVNSGVGGATSWAQAVCGITADGDMGPRTKAAILAMDPEDFIHEFCSHRLGTLQRLPTWGTFGKGWSARIANVQKAAISMAEMGDEPDAPEVSTIGGHSKARPTDIPVSKTSVIVAHATTVGGALATGAAQAGTSLAPASDTFAFIKYVLGGLTIVGAVAGAIVYFAKKADDLAATSTRKAKVDVDADAALSMVPVVVPPPAGEAHG